MLSPKPLPRYHGETFIEFWIVCRDDGNRIEIAEHADGAMKAYDSKAKAELACKKMSRRNTGAGWRVETIWVIDKGYDAHPAVFKLAETGLFSKQALLDINGLMEELERRSPA